MCPLIGPLSHIQPEAMDGRGRSKAQMSLPPASLWMTKSGNIPLTGVCAESLKKAINFFDI